MILQLTKWTYHKSLLLAVPLFSFLASIIRSEVLGKEENINQLLVILCMFLGDSLSFIFEIISIYRQQRNKKDNQPIPVNSIATIKKRTILNWEKIINYALIFLISVINFFVSIGILYLGGDGKEILKEFSLKVVMIIVTVILSHFVFNYNTYNHQICAMVLVFLGQIGIYFTAPNLFTQIDLFYIVTYCVSPIYTIIEKWLLDTRFVSPYHIVAWEGVFGVFITLFANYIRSLISCDNAFCTNMPPFLFETCWGLVFGQLYYWLLIFTYLFANVGYGLINKYFNPNHRIASATLSSVCVVFSQIHKKRNIALTVIANLLILIGCIIYNEIIILFFCNCHQDTIDEIERRSLCEVVKDQDLQILENMHEEMLINN